MSKLAGIKKGDRVKVSFEGRVSSISPRGVNVTDEGLYYDSKIREVGADLPHFESTNFTIKVIESPLKVGDPVFNAFCLNHSRGGKIEALIEIDGEQYAVVSGFAGIPGIGKISEYVRKPE